MSRPDFSRIWGSDNAPFTPIEASDYAAGWVFRTGAPPRRVNFDYFQNLSDQRTAWLGEQMLLAVGHEWQDDVTYDLYAVVRSPMDGQLYKSKSAVNLGNEPSVSASEWQVVTIGNEGVIQQLGAPVYVTATGTVIHPADYKHVLVEIVGGGGGGGGAVGNSTHTGGGGGGGAGAYSRKMFTFADVGAATLCTIGAGGAGGVGAGAGGAGGTTSFASLAQAGGGAGGNGTTLSATFNVADGGGGGSVTEPTGRDYPNRGGAGGNGWTFGATSVNRGIAGDGGASFFGAGGPGKALLGSDVYAGVTATSPGAGGSGGGVGSSSATTRNGGNGAAGLIRLTYYK